MNGDPPIRADRAVWVSLGTLILAGAAFSLRENGPNGVSWLPGCVFHQLTGLHCPGCGMTRATYAALHGNIGQAFRFNPVGMILLPLGAVALALETIGWIRGKPLPLRMKLGSVGAWTILGIVFAFWILRNFPWWQFTLLAPP